VPTSLLHARLAATSTTHCPATVACCAGRGPAGGGAAVVTDHKAALCHCADMIAVVGLSTARIKPLNDRDYHNAVCRPMVPSVGSSTFNRCLFPASLSATVALGHNTLQYSKCGCTQVQLNGACTNTTLAAACGSARQCSCHSYYGACPALWNKLQASTDKTSRSQDPEMDALLTTPQHPHQANKWVPPLCCPPAR